jgi:hypothetical protein
VISIPSAIAPISVEYRINPKDRNAFLSALYQLARQRRRDGAYRWGVFEDAAEEGRFVETFLVESWLEHLRQHERVTNAELLSFLAPRRKAVKPTFPLAKEDRSSPHVTGAATVKLLQGA